MEQELEQQPVSLSLSFSPSVVNDASAPSSSGEESSPADAVIFFGLSLAMRIACRHLLRGTRVPYTVALLIIGIALGSLGHTFGIALGSLEFVAKFMSMYRKISGNRQYV